MNIESQKQQTAFLKAMDAAMAKEGLSAPRNAVVDMALGSDIKMNLKKKDASILGVLTSMLAKTPDSVIKMPQGIAKRILEEANFPRQRDVRESRKKKHKQRLENGTWRGESFPITFALIPANGDQPEKLWLINGQHRVTVISEHHAAVPIKVIIANVPDEEEAATLYTYFDDPSESRSDIEVLDAKGVTDELQLPRDAVRALYGALSFLRNDLEPAYYQVVSGEAARDRDGRMHDIKEWANEARVFWQDINISDHWTKRRLLRPAVMALALYTYRYQPGKAHDFWSGIARQDGLAKGDPRDTLLKDFRNRMSTEGGKGNNNQRIVIQSASLAWNAFCEKRELAIIKCLGGAILKVWGTPYQNGNRR
jgi:hypothetical protein